MKKSLIPILSLLFIISLDSCKKDKDQPQPEEQQDDTRLVKVSSSYSNNSITDVVVFHYDESGRVISIQDSAGTREYYNISYVGDEAIFKPMGYSGLYYSGTTINVKLNNNYQMVQRIKVDSTNAMRDVNPRFYVGRDICKYEYDAAGLLVKATGTIYDSSWSKNSGKINFYAINEAYTRTYTNDGQKLMYITTNGIENEDRTQDGVRTKTTYNKDGKYTFEYNNNYANKIDLKNAWVYAELELFFSYKYPMIKTYPNRPEKMNFIETTTNAATGTVVSTSKESYNISLEYAPSGYVSTLTSLIGSDRTKSIFTYNK